MHALSPTPAPRERGALLALAFGTTVAMWTAGYIGRLPFVNAPAWLVGAAMLAVMFGGGFAAGRWWRRGWSGGVQVGLVTAVINMLVLGSLLASPEDPNRVAPSALLWLPGALIAGAGVGALGAISGSGGPAPRSVHWTGVLSRVAAAATLLLVAVGGLVTSHGAGLAVTDWPNSFGYNMFLYPLSRMTGGVYYEHAHRLFGSLVGLTTLTLALHLLRVEPRRWVKVFGVAALALVVVQGVLGGLRVTGRFTMSTDAADMAPSTFLAALHGVTGQVFFAVMIALAVVTSATWVGHAERRASKSAGTDRALGLVLLACLLLQLILGAALRHHGAGLLVHISMAAVVVLGAVVVGVRAWGPADRPPLIKRLGVLLLAAVSIQVILGFGALIAVGTSPGASASGALRAALATPHQVMGAVLFGLATALALWERRLIAADRKPA